MPFHLRAAVLVTSATFWFMAGMWEDRPKPPKVVHAPSVMTEFEDLRVEVRSEPHPDRRTVILEAWEAEPVRGADQDQEATLLYEPRRLVRSSFEPVGEGNAGQRTFPFHWRAGVLRPGMYVLIARVVVGRGLSYASPSHRVQVV